MSLGWTLLSCAATGAIVFVLTRRMCRLTEQDASPTLNPAAATPTADEIAGRKVAEALAVAEDEKRNIEQRLKAERDRANHYLEAMQAIVVAMDDKARISMVNQKGCEVLGYTQAELLGQRWFEMCLPQPEGVRDVLPIYELLMQGRLKNTEYYENAILTKAGELRTIAWHNTLLRDEQGNICGTLSAGEDITDRLKADELRLAKSNAEAANRAKSAFLANMSHEIRTPMNAILGFTQLLGADPELPARLKSHVEVIGRNGEHLLSVINSILELSKIEANRVSLNPEDFNLRGLISDVQSLFALRVTEKRLHLRLDVDGSVPTRVNGDPVKIRQILVNVIGNAVKFTEYGAITFQVVSTTEPDSSHVISFRVSDTGPGIAPSELPNLFRYFEQTETGRRIGQGSGLGLAISREYARLHGGDIFVESQVGIGSTFEIRVRVQPSATRPKAVDAGSRPPRSREENRESVVLVVDDVPDNRAFLRRALSDAGFPCIEAENGRTAVEKFRSAQPPVVLMDLLMPVMDGDEAIAEIRRVQGAANPYIVALSASVLDDRKDAVIRAGADKFVSKPFSVALLIKEIEDVLRQRTVSRTGKAAGSTAPATLTKQMSRAIAKAAVEADIHALNRLIEELDLTHPAYAESLRVMVSRFAYDEVLQSLGPSS